MECGRCGRSNPGHVRYCLDCGSVLREAAIAPAAKTHLGASDVAKTQNSEVPPAPPATNSGRVDCPTCGADNPDDASFCRECGSRLNLGPPPAQPSALPQLPLADAQRPPLTGTLVAASRPAALLDDIRNENPAVAEPGRGTLASAQASPLAAPPPQQRNDVDQRGAVIPRDTPPPAAERGAQQNRYAPATADALRGGALHANAAAPPAQAQPNHAQPDHRVADAADGGARHCHACGGSSGPSARFCQLCGLPFERASGERPRSNPPLAAPVALPDAELVVIAQDGSPGRRYPLTSEHTIIGNGEVDISLRKDPYVSPVHAEISYRNGRFHLLDRGSLNGVFVRLGGSVPLTSGDLLLVGLGVLRFEIVEEAERNLAPQTRNGTRVFGTPPAPRYARLTTQTVEGVARDRHYLARAETVLGREVGDIVFTDDPFMSRRHAAIRRDPNTNKFSIRDLGSSNGTFIALRDEHTLSPGDHIRIGQHLFRLDVRGNG